MHIIDKRKKNTVFLRDIAIGSVFEDLEGVLFIKIDLDGSCYPSGLNYGTTDAAIDLDDFEVCFFDNTAEVCPVCRAELTIS